MTYLTNAFSLQMINGAFEAKVRIKKLSADQACLKLQDGFTSAVGHEDTAKFLSEFLGIYIPCNRFNLRLEDNDTLIVAQYVKGRLNGEPIQFNPEDFRFYEVKLLERRI